MIEKCKHLHGERLIDLEQVNVGDRETGASKRFFGAWDGTDTHDLRLDAGEREPNHAHLRGQAQFGSEIGAGEEGSGGAVRKP